MKKLFTKKYLVVGLIALMAIGFLAASSGVAMAQTAPAPTIASSLTGTSQTPGIFSCATNLATCLVYFVSLTLNSVVGLLIAIGGYLIRFALAFNENIFSSPFVQKGFGISLSLANLGFVLGIIIIAIATILRRESYGYKQTLWKLVAMAILVNFGLVITAPIISFSDSMTSYFVSAVGGGQGAAAGAAGYGYSGPSGSAFVVNITNAFQPQALLAQQATSTTSTGSTLASLAVGFLVSMSNTFSFLPGVPSIGSPAGIFAQSLLALIFSVIFSIIIAFTYFALAALLIVRYVFILILLVILPLGWLMWIFPNFSHLFSRWWSEFIKWTFFPVVAMFFIYLAYIMIAPTNPNTPNQTANTYVTQIGKTANTGVPQQNLPETTIAQNIALNPANAAGPIQASLDAIALSALMIGGLVAASSLTGKFGGFVVEQAKAASNGIQGYVGKQSKKAARATYQRVGGKHINEALQTSRIPGVSILGRTLATATEKGGKKLVDEASKEASEKSSDRLALELQGFMGKEKQFAYLAELQKRADLEKVSTISGKTLPEFINQNKTAFEQYGQGKLKNDINKSIGSDEDMRKAAEDFAAGIAGAEAILKAATKKFNENLSVSDVQKGQIDSMFLDPHDAATTGKSFGLSEAAYKAVQEKHVFSMGKHASTQTLTELHKKLAKGGQQAQFDLAMKSLVSGLKAAAVPPIPPGTPLSLAQYDVFMNGLFSPANRRWIESNGAQNMGIDPKNWGLDHV